VPAMNYNKSNRICKRCKNIIPPADYKKIFCSQSCAATFNNLNRAPRTMESKQKTSDTLKRLIKQGLIRLPLKYKKYKYPYTKLYERHCCHSCSKSFWQTSYRQKCCSKICRDNICSQNKCKKLKLNYYNKHTKSTIILLSSWEVKIASWLDKYNIVWIPPTNRIKWYDTTLQKIRTYLPDFYLPEYKKYLDVKNPVKFEKDKDKISQLISIMPLYVGDIIQIKKYVAALAELEPASIQ
jgi:hypothetical protein